MQGEAAPSDGETVLKECVLRDGIEYCRTVSPDPAAPDGAAAQTDYFAWARPVLDDPVGWAQQNILNLDVLLPVLYQIGAVLAAVLLGALLAPSIRRQASGLVGRLPKRSVNTSAA